MGKAIYNGVDSINVNLSSGSLSLRDYAEGYVGRRSLVMHLPAGHTDSGARIGCCTIPEPTETEDQFEETCEMVQPLSVTSSPMAHREPVPLVKSKSPSEI